MQRFKYVLVSLIISLVLLSACADKPPSRDEIPLIKDLLGKLQTAIKDRNQAAIDSLMIYEALDLGYSSSQILDEVCGEYWSGDFWAFAQKEIIYADKKGTVNCFLAEDSTSSDGRQVSMTIVKVDDSWLLKRFDLK